MNQLELRITIRELIEPTLLRLGFDLVAVEWLGSRQGRILRLSIDRPAGVTADDCGLAADNVSPILDELDPISTRYHLEVSSPGIDRPVQRIEDFERFHGYQVKIRLFEGPPRRRYTGTIDGVEGDELRVLVDGSTHRVLLDSIERAHLVLDLKEYQKLQEVAHGAD
jgi:ribosome maturation factor RimP